jgi:hypothetical protein
MSIKFPVFCFVTVYIQMISLFYLIGAKGWEDVRKGTVSESDSFLHSSCFLSQYIVSYIDLCLVNRLLSLPAGSLELVSVKLCPCGTLQMFCSSGQIFTL